MRTRAACPGLQLMSYALVSFAVGCKTAGREPAPKVEMAGRKGESGIGSQERLLPKVQRALDAVRELGIARAQAHHEGDSAEVERLDQELAKLWEGLSDSERPQFERALEHFSERLEALPKPHLVFVQISADGKLEIRGSHVDLAVLRKVLTTERAEYSGTQVVLVVDRLMSEAQTRRVDEIADVVAKVGLPPAVPVERGTLTALVNTDQGFARALEGELARRGAKYEYAPHGQLRVFLADRDEPLVFNLGAIEQQCRELGTPWPDALRTYFDGILPTAHSLAFHVLESRAAAVATVGSLAHLAQRLFDEGERPVSREVYWWKSGQLSRIDAEIGENGSVTVAGPAAFVELMEKLPTKPMQ